MSRFLQSNGIRMHLVEEGSGPLVVLLHGFPELSSTWRHQLRALAEAGYHAVAPDQRGYGQTDCPERDDAYTMLHLAGLGAARRDARRGEYAGFAGAEGTGTSPVGSRATRRAEG